MTASGWRTRAACRPGSGIDAEAFFPIGAGAASAKKICAACPVAAPCLDDALAAGPYSIGIYGGTTEHERRQILRNRTTTEHDHPAETRQAALDPWTTQRGHYATDGACARAVAKQLDVTSHTTILNWVRAAGIADEPKTRPRTPEERAAAINDYQRVRGEHRSGTAAMDAVAAEHGIARSALRGWLRDAGVIDPKPQRPRAARGRTGAP